MGYTTKFRAASTLSRPHRERRQSSSHLSYMYDRNEGQKSQAPMPIQGSHARLDTGIGDGRKKFYDRGLESGLSFERDARGQW